MATQAVRALTACVSTSYVAISNLTGFGSAYSSPRMLGVALTALGASLCVRLAMHRLWLIGPRSSRRLLGLVRLEAVICISWACATGAVFAWPHAWLVLVTTVALGASAYFHGGAIDDEARRCGLKGATERLAAQPQVQWIREKLADGGDVLASLGRLFGPAERDQASISRYVRFVALCCLAILGTSAPQAVGEIRQAVAPTPSVAEGPPESDSPKRPPAHESAHGSPLASGPVASAGRESSLPVVTAQEQCGAPPGEGEAPRHIATALRSLARHTGTTEAGCPQAPERVPRQQAWTMEGICGRAPRSLAVVGSDGKAAILLGTQATLIGRSLADRGALLGASERRALSSGDVQILSTTGGPIVLVRDNASSTTSGQGTECTTVGTATSSYVQLSAALARRWLSLLSDGVAWPVEEGEADGLRQYSFVADGPEGAVVATAVCGQATCKMVRRDGTRIEPAVAGLTVDAILAAGAP